MCFSPLNGDSKKCFRATCFQNKKYLEEQLLIAVDESTHEERLSQPLQTNCNQFYFAISFLTGYNVVFKFTKKFELFSAWTFDDNEYKESHVPTGVFELQSLNGDFTRKVIEKNYAEKDFPFLSKLIFSTLGSIRVTKLGWQISYVPDYTIGGLLGFQPVLIFEKYNSWRKLLYINYYIKRLC